MLIHNSCGTPLRPCEFFDEEDPESPVRFYCDVCEIHVDDPDESHVIDSTRELEEAMNDNA